MPSGAEQAAQPTPEPGAITGVVWRDFKPGGGTPGKLEQGEVGLPGVTVELRDSSGKTRRDRPRRATTATFTFADVEAGRLPRGDRLATRSGSRSAASSGSARS